MLAVGGLLFVWSGIYSVGASAGHWAITRVFLEFALRSSVRTHSFFIDPPPLDDDDMVRLGAGHFAGGCAPCHGSPGEPRNPITRNMLPPPPRLSDPFSHWEPQELFWIVENGIKYTGMPAWVSPVRPDEVWTVVAFLKRLGTLSAEDYAAMSKRPQVGGAEPEPEDDATFSEALVLCARCHGDEDFPPSSSLVPSLSGQNARYMESALRDYANGSRFSGIMQPVAAELDDAAIERLSAYYSALAGSRRERAEPPAEEQIARGRRIVEGGVPERGIPPCLACHGEGASEIFPRLQGQSARYLLTQLELFKRGARGRSTTSAIMQTIAARLNEEQMEDAAAFLENAAGGGSAP